MRPRVLSARLRTFLHALVHPRRLRSEIDNEIAFHLESRTHDLIRSGLTPHEASRQARIEFGAQPTHAHAMRQAFGSEWIASVLADLAYAWRLLRRNKGFTAITVLSLALAIGANSAIFSTANELLFARLDVPHSRQLRKLEYVVKGHSPIHSYWGEGENDTGSTGISKSEEFPYPLYQRLAGADPSIFAYKHEDNATVSVAGESRVVPVEMVSGSYFNGMQVTPVLGRSITAADDRVQDGGPLVVLLGYGFWQDHFGASLAVLGRVIRIDGAIATIIGVTPRGFTGASSAQVAPNLFVPLTAVSLLKPTIGKNHPLTSANLDWVDLTRRLAPSESASGVTAHLATVFGAAARASYTLAKGESIPSLLLIDGSRGLNTTQGFYAQPLYVMLALSALVLLLACVNVANLMLARSTVRQRELDVRMALGAERGRLFRQMLTECLLIAVLGGSLGFLLAFAARDVIPSLLWNAQEQGGALQIPFNWPVFAFTAAVSILAALLSGLAPAWRATRSQPAAALKQAGPTGTRRRAWGGKLLVGVQVALSALLVAGSAMFLRTITGLEHVAPGFDTHQLLLFGIDLPQSRYLSPNDITTHQRLLASLRSVPGVESATLSDVPLLAGYIDMSSISLEHTLRSLPQVAQDERISRTGLVGQDFLGTMHIPLVAGRTFNSSDTATSAPVTVVTQAFAQRFFGRYNPIGQRFSGDGKAPWTTIIGVCANIRYSSLRDAPPPVFFDLYMQQKSVEQATYIIRSPLPPATLIPSLRRAVANIDRNLPLTNIRTQDEQISELLSQERLFAALSTGFGLLALALACAGVYGVFSYAVAGRTREIGIRLALGAPRNQVRVAILREALTLSTIALAAGLGATLSLAKLIKSLLYDVSAIDPVSLTATTALLLAVAILAAWLPAARASRVDPMHALRHE